MLQDKFIFPGPEIVHPDDVPKWVDEDPLGGIEDLYRPAVTNLFFRDMALFQQHSWQREIVGFKPVTKYQNGVEMHYYF
jgi:hypothetical protein